MNQAARSRWMLLATAFLFSTGGAAIKACGLTTWQVASFRSAVSAVALLILLPDARRGWTWRALPVAATYAATLVLFVLATRNTTAANAIFLQASGPMYLILAGPLFLKEPIRRSEILLLLCLGAGMWLFFLDPVKISSMAPNPEFGNFCGALSGATWAGTVLGLRWISRTNPDSLAPAAPAQLEGSKRIPAPPHPGRRTSARGDCRGSGRSPASRWLPLFPCRNGASESHRR